MPGSDTRVAVGRVSPVAAIWVAPFLLRDVNVPVLKAIKVIQVKMNLG